MWFAGSAWGFDFSFFSARRWDANASRLRRSIHAKGAYSVGMTYPSPESLQAYGGGQVVHEFMKQEKGEEDKASWA